MKRSVKQSLREKISSAYMRIYEKEQQPILLKILKSKKELICIFECLEKTPDLSDPAVQFAFSALRIRVNIIMGKEATNQEFINIFGLIVICIEEVHLHIFNKPATDKIKNALSATVLC